MDCSGGRNGSLILSAVVALWSSFYGIADLSQSREKHHMNFFCVKSPMLERSSPKLQISSVVVG